MATVRVVGLDLAGRTALVTGAGSGIGRACAERLAAAGARVLVVDVDAEAASTVAAAIGGEAVTADLSDPDAAGALPAEVDVLVNNAGLQFVAAVQDFPPERFAYIQKVMVEAPFRLIRRVLPHMYDRGWGRIVNISSVHGLIASPYKSAYVTAKHGLEGLSKTVALEAATHGVTSNCVNPAFVRTPLVDKQVADQAVAHGIPESEVISTIMLERAAIKRLIEPEQVAELVAYLCTPAAEFITGASIAMDGGWTAH
jgi:3-hydroxybutyrate dehydrogenase